MGNSSSECKNLHEYGDACEIYPCVQKVTGLSSNSSSPTDTWILEFDKGTNYDSTPINKAFVKWFVSSKSLNLYPGIGEDYMESILGLEYEINIYRSVIRPLIDLNICPNFVRYLGSGTKCTYNDLLNMLQNKGDVLPNNELEENLERNILYMLNKMRKRPSINDYRGNKHDWENIEKIRSQTKYNMLVNELVDMSKTRTFSKVLDNELGKGLTPEIWSLIFQVIAGCYSMSLSKMVHNDLHTGNIWVVKIPKTKLTYIINDECYTFYSENKPEIYDFDRSYVERFGINKKSQNDGRSCLSNSQCSEYIPNKDMFKFFSYLYYDLYVNGNKTDTDKILYILGKNNESVARIHNSFKTGSDHGYWLRDTNKKVWKKKDYEKFNSAEKILELVGKEMIENNKDCEEKADVKHTYICNKNMFDKNGDIIVKTESHIYEMERKIIQLNQEIDKLKENKIEKKSEKQIKKKQINQKMNKFKKKNLI
jgi:hypothetical protein